MEGRARLVFVEIGTWGGAKGRTHARLRAGESSTRRHGLGGGAVGLSLATDARGVRTRAGSAYYCDCPLIEKHDARGARLNWVGHSGLKGAISTFQYTCQSVSALGEQGCDLVFGGVLDHLLARKTALARPDGRSPGSHVRVRHGLLDGEGILDWLGKHPITEDVVLLGA